MKLVCKAEARYDGLRGNRKRWGENMIIQAPIFDMEENVWTIGSLDMQTRKYLLSEIGMGDYRGVGFNESYLSTLYGEWKKENKETGITQRKFAEKNDMELSEFKKKVLMETVEAKRIIDDAVQKQFEKYVLKNKDEIFKIQLGLYKKKKRYNTKRLLREMYRTKDGVCIDFYEKISGLKYPKDYDKVMEIGKFSKAW